VVPAYTLAIDSVPVLGTVLLISLLVLAQSVVMITGRRSGALALARGRRLPRDDGVGNDYFCAVNRRLGQI